MIDRELLKILVCPVEKGELVYLESESKLRCQSCGRVYPIRNGIPIMLIDEATAPKFDRKGFRGDSDV